MRKGKRIGRIPVEAKMRGISGHHFKEGRLVGILKTEFEAKAISQRQPVVGNVTGINGSVFLILAALDDVTPVRGHIKPDIGRARF